MLIPIRSGGFLRIIPLQPPLQISVRTLHTKMLVKSMEFLSVFKLSMRPCRESLKPYKMKRNSIK
uniref:Uncharacterized protein n=1 Tax=Medicago truncatula TaxID=3880 RepID=I3SG36_MEDTR|nr:unknown [Medicago truncatula]